MRVPKKILLLVNSDPESSGVGEIFLREIAGGLQGVGVVRYSTLRRRSRADQEWFGAKSFERRVPWSRWPAISSFTERYAWNRVLPRIVDDIDAIVNDEDIELIWAVLSSPTVIAASAEIARRSSIPVVSTVLDDPEYLMAGMNLDPAIRLRVLQKFECVLAGSKKVSVIGESMRDYYIQKYGVDSIVMRHGVAPEYCHSWSGRKHRDVFEISFAGSLYAKAEWNAFIGALDSVNWVIGSTAIRVNFIGRLPRLGVRTSPNVRQLGSMSMSEAIDAVARSDAAYLPYWFEESHSLVCKTSFPGKLSAYAAAGVPVFFHGPNYASGTEFLTKYPFGVRCASMRDSDIRESLEELIFDPSMSLKAKDARDQAIRRELGNAVMRQRFWELISFD